MAYIALWDEAVVEDVGVMFLISVSYIISEKKFNIMARNRSFLILNISITHTVESRSLALGFHSPTYQTH